jgi:SAM-dependent methyltransferase
VSAETASPAAAPRITRTPDGRAYLHVWRTGRSYAEQKGALYRGEWTNVRFNMWPAPPDESDILHHDVRKPLLYPDETFDAAYALHVIEHLTPAEGRSFVNELYRVLKPGGILRISTPDLENIARSYLWQLDECRTSRSDRNMIRYRWAVYELLDQIVRERPGGLMTQAATNGDFDPDFARIRYGDVFAEFAARREPARGWRERLAALTPSSFVAGVRWRIRRIVRPSRDDPRFTGELNKWMYDELSVEALVTACGFQGVQRQDYRSSTIPNWNRYKLDESNDGTHAIEPSLYVEASKPARC